MCGAIRVVDFSEREDSEGTIRQVRENNKILEELCGAH